MPTFAELSRIGRFEIGHAIELNYLVDYFLAAESPVQERIYFGCNGNPGESRYESMIEEFEKALRDGERLTGYFNQEVAPDWSAIGMPLFDGYSPGLLSRPGLHAVCLYFRHYCKLEGNGYKIERVTLPLPPVAV